jgi:hypothetical protein
MTQVQKAYSSALGLWQFTRTVSSCTAASPGSGAAAQQSLQPTPTACASGTAGKGRPKGGVSATPPKDER